MLTIIRNFSYACKVTAIDNTRVVANDRNQPEQPFHPSNQYVEIDTMSKKTTLKPLAVAMGAAFVTSLAGAGVANAADNPFAMSDLSSGYMVAESHTKDMEGKCGEGKCGEKMKSSEGKCGEKRMKS